MASFAINTLKAKNVAVIDDSTAYGQGLADSFERTVKAAGVAVLGHEHTTDKDTDFNAILTNLKAKNPEYIFFWRHLLAGRPDGQADEGLGHERQTARQGTVRKRRSSSNWRAMRQKAPTPPCPVCPRTKCAGGKAFLDKFEAKFHKKVELFAPMGYDAVFVIAEAMKRANATEPAKYLPELKKTKRDGVIGPIEFDDKGDLKMRTSPSTR